MTQIPQWLAEHIETTTGMRPGQRNARASRCLQCRARTLAGLDSDTAALHVHVDPQPLNHLGEALAQLSNRSTYALRYSCRNIQLTRRDQWQIAGSPAATYQGPRAYDVVAAHECGQQLPTVPSCVPFHLAVKGENNAPPF